MPSNVDSGDPRLRRFLVLEDIDADFDVESKFLCDLCRISEQKLGHNQKIENIEIMRLRALAPKPHRLPAGLAGDYNDRPTPTFLTAPLAVKASEGELYRFTREGDVFSALGLSPFPHDPMLVVPWRTISISSADYFMPHAVLLDIMTDHSDNAFLATKELLRGAWYPSDLVWILSSGGGENEPYGIFFPKFEILSEAQSNEAREHLLRRLGSIFATHARRHMGFKKDEQGVSSYLDEKAQMFYEKYVVPESWRKRVELTGNHSGSDTGEHTRLQRVWSRFDGVAPAEKKIFRWAVSDTPTNDTGVFSFFTNELKGEDQWRYAAGRSFGLPFRYLVDVAPRAPEDVIAAAARDYVDRQTSFIFRRNLAVFLYMVLGSMDNFNGLNSAIPSLDLSQATFHGIANEVLGEELAAAQLEVKARRKTAGRGRPFVDWLNNTFLGSTQTHAHR